MFLQDVKECPGPQSKLTELNADVKKSFHNLRSRIQVRNCVSADTKRQQPNCASASCTFLCFKGFRADGHGAGQGIRQAGHSQSSGGTQKADAQVMSCHLPNNCPSGAEKISCPFKKTRGSYIFYCFAVTRHHGGKPTWPASCPSTTRRSRNSLVDQMVLQGIGKSV